MKILPVGAEGFHAEGRTGMMKLIIAFHNFANGPKMSVRLQVMWWDRIKLSCPYNPLYFAVLKMC
jgi:hypothetical protein